jgi:hypothetical protein
MSNLSEPVTTGEPITLDSLKVQYPRWSFWMGHVTGEPWAAPPPEHRAPLVSARTIAELAAKVAEQDAAAMDGYLP